MSHRLWVIALAAGAAAVQAAGAADPPEAELLRGAAERIAKHRQADATVVVVDAAGRPVPGAEVTVEQTRHAFLFGCNIFLWGRAGGDADEEAYRGRFRDVFNFATLPFYWFSYEPRRGQQDHDRVGRIARWCREQGIATKGHPLAWNHTDPRWLPDDLEEVRTLQMARIDDCVSRFRGLIDTWDVVNEPTHFERDECQRRAPRLTAMWGKAGRAVFVRECFRHARAANPRATLLINDYRTDEAYAALLTELGRTPGGRPFDVVGLQSHMHRGPWPAAKVWDVCERFARFGVPLHFTEATILSGQPGWELARPGQPWPSTPEGEARQADEVERLYTLLFSHPAVAAVTWWDFADRGAWQPAPAGLLRADLSPKPAYTRLHDLVKDRWWTRATARTGDDGAARVRAFHGEHQVTVRVGDRRAGTTATVAKGAANRLTVTLP
jgi:GH35 family endo-1,4-beta-xylanase